MAPANKPVYRLISFSLIGNTTGFVSITKIIYGTPVEDYIVDNLSQYKMHNIDNQNDTYRFSYNNNNYVEANLKFNYIDLNDNLLKVGEANFIFNPAPQVITVIIATVQIHLDMSIRIMV